MSDNMSRNFDKRGYAARQRAKLIYELIEMSLENGITRDSLVDTVKDEYSDLTSARKGVGAALVKLLGDDTVCEIKGRLYIKGYAPENGTAPARPERIAPPSGGLGGMVRQLSSALKLSPHARKRTPRRISVYTSPLEYDDIQRVIVHQNGGSFEIPLSGLGLNICIGDGIPEWTPDQTINYGVTMISITHLDGKVSEIPVNPKHPVTFDVKDSE